MTRKDWVVFFVFISFTTIGTGILAATSDPYITALFAGCYATLTSVNVSQAYTRKK